MALAAAIDAGFTPWERCVALLAPRLRRGADLKGVEMLLSTYAKCVDGQEALARERIEQALGWKDDEAP